MMIGRLGVRYQPLHERHRFGKTRERELLAKAVALERPSLQRLKVVIDLRLREYRHTWPLINRTWPGA